MFGSLLALGFLLGMRHALEADHVAAVLSLASRTSLRRDTTRAATAWGAGHALALVVIGTALIALRISLPAALARLLEFVAAVVLVVLGCDVLRHVRARRIHVHVHQHDDGTRHVHAHAHGDGGAHDQRAHAHAHTAGLMPRALLVGALHGGAGSAGVVLLSLQAIDTAGRALAYLWLFALGTVLGMVALSLAVTVPLRVSGTRLARVSLALDAAVGLSSVALGCWMVVAATSSATLP
jgi:ABC-type nickel/cobalt efflux system permease component RcnA